jgi:hypothetical protein
MGPSLEKSMEQRNQTHSGETDAPESTSLSLPKRYIPWVPLIGVLQLLITAAIFAIVVAPYIGHEDPVTTQGTAAVAQTGRT